MLTFSIHRAIISPSGDDVAGCTLSDGGDEMKTYSTKEALEKIGINRRRLMILENKYEIFKIDREKNPASGTEDRRFSEDDVKLVRWVDRLLKEGRSLDYIKLATEYFETGRITSIKWYK